MNRFEELKRRTVFGSGMPRYKCHKEVWALKIGEIVVEQMPPFSQPTCRGSFALGSACGHCERCTWVKEHGPGMGAILVPEDRELPPILVTADFIRDRKVEAGGYYVVYDDGYRSFSPARAFEEGYARM